jgi:hypothetical protein
LCCFCCAAHHGCCWWPLLLLSWCISFFVVVSRPLLQNRLYIGSLPLSMDRDAVEQEFKQFGKVTNVWIAKNVRERTEEIERRSRGSFVCSV